MVDEKLSPCPWCGSAAEIEHVGTKFGVRWTVGCNERADDGSVLCYGYQSLTTFATKREAITAWNRRAPEDELALDFIEAIARMSMGLIRSRANEILIARGRLPIDLNDPTVRTAPTED